MRRWFLSYHSQDLKLAERLKAALERSHSDACVFFAPSSLRAGSFWSKALAEEIAQADAFILLVGENGVGDWQVLEYDEALDRRVKSPNFPVVLLLLKGQTAPGLPFLRRLHWIVTADPASENAVVRLIDAAAGAGTRLDALWRYTSPYRGLAAMEERDSDYFFGRKQETVDVLSALAVKANQVPVLFGNSGVGKSSLAQAGVLAALKRQAWPEGVDGIPEWPHAFKESRRWCFLTLKPGTEPVKELVEAFLDTWQFGGTDPDRVKQQNGWIELLLDRKAELRDLLDATERRYKELNRPKPPAFLLYVDQGEELYVRAVERQRHRFSELIAYDATNPRLYILMSMRSDFLGELQKDETLFSVHRQINVPPLREAELREVVKRPAELLSACFETPELADIITRRTADDTVKDVGALPLLSYTLDDMWTQMVKRDDGVLRLPAESFELGGVLVDRADAFLAAHPKAQDKLRRILTLKLATVREDEKPTRRRALRSEFSHDEWWLVTELTDHPNRLLVTATPVGGEPYVEVAHEAIFQRWGKLRNWIAVERKFLDWKTGLEAARRTWQNTPEYLKNDALLMGAALTQAQSWLTERREDLSGDDCNFIDQSRERQRRSRVRARRVQALVYALLFAVIAGLVGWIKQSDLRAQINWFGTMRPYMLAEVRPYVLRPDAERLLKSGDSFRECARDCPEMIVIPGDEFTMGSPATEEGRSEDEGPQHKVRIAQAFAVSKFDVTFADWNACVSVGGCPQVEDSDFGQSTRPVINVTWDAARHYLAWFSKMTARPYRLLTEAEWEYAARARTTTAYFWGDEIGIGNANCNLCGSKWDSRKTSPVGSFKPNKFGLYDMAGNVWQWVEDCYSDSYEGAPRDGSARKAGDCGRRVVRGGAWLEDPQKLRSAYRGGQSISSQDYRLGFRVARTLTP